MSISDLMKYSLEYVTLRLRVRKKNTESKTEIRLVIASFSVILSGNWYRSNRYLRLINTKQRHIFIIWVYGERIRVLFSTLPISAHMRLPSTSVTSYRCSFFHSKKLADWPDSQASCRKTNSPLLHIYISLLATRRGEHISKASSVHQASRASVLVKSPVTK